MLAIWKKKPNAKTISGETRLEKCQMLWIRGKQKCNLFHISIAFIK